MPKTDTYSLDVSSPEDVPAVLRAVAERYFESQSELQSAWQDEAAGREWAVIARIFERVAAQIERKLGA